MADDGEFGMMADSERRPAIYYKGDLLGHLTKGRSLVAPVFKPVRAIGELEGDALRDIVTRAEVWIEAQLAKHIGGIIALHTLSQDENIDGNVRALAVQLAEAGGVAGRAYLADALAGLPKEARGAARKGGIVFGALDVFHHGALKPAAAKWRAALFAARDERPLSDLPPESAVHLKDWKFANMTDCRNAGYRRIGDEYLRIDLAERVIKKAHEARGQAAVFGMDMAFATSLGIGEAGLEALMQNAGFKKAQAPVDDAVADEHKAAEDEVAAMGEAAVAETVDAPEQEAEHQAPEPEKSADMTPEPSPATDDVAEAIKEEISVESDKMAQDIATENTEQSIKTEQSAMVVQSLVEPVLTYWRWVGIRKNRPQHARGNNDRAGQGRTKFAGNAKTDRDNNVRQARKGGKGRSQNQGAPARPKAEPKPPSSLALQLAALQALQTPKP